MATAEEHIAMLREQGYAVFPGLYSDAYLQRCIAEYERLFNEAGRPELSSSETIRLNVFDLAVSACGLNYRKLLLHAPSLAPDFLHPDIREVLYGALGSDLRVEATGGTMSDTTRIMHSWHYHVGGLDEDLKDPAQITTLEPDKMRRITMLIYLDEISPETGQLLIYPRKLADPIDCPFPELPREEWPGQIALSLPRGTAVLTEERTWHASHARKTPGRRRFMACWFKSASAPKTHGVDDSVPLFENILLHRSA